MKKTYRVLAIGVLSVIFMTGCMGSRQEIGALGKASKMEPSHNLAAAVEDVYTASNEPLYIIIQNQLIGSYEHGQWNSYMTREDLTYQNNAITDNVAEKKRRPIDMTELLGQKYWVYIDDELYKTHQNRQKNLGIYRGAGGYAGSLYFSIGEHCEYALPPSYVQKDDPDFSLWGATLWNRLFTANAPILLKAIPDKEEDHLEQYSSIIQNVLRDYGLKEIGNPTVDIRKMDFDGDNEAETLLLARWDENPIIYYRNPITLYKNSPSTDEQSQERWYSLAVIIDGKQIRPLYIHIAQDEAIVNEYTLMGVTDIDCDGHLELFIRTEWENTGCINSESYNTYAAYEYNDVTQKYEEILLTESTAQQEDNALWQGLPYLMNFRQYCYEYGEEIDYVDLPSLMLFKDHHIEITLDQRIDPSQEEPLKTYYGTYNVKHIEDDGSDQITITLEEPIFGKKVWMLETDPDDCEAKSLQYRDPDTEIYKWGWGIYDDRGFD